MKYSSPLRKKQGARKVKVTTETVEYLKLRGVPATSARRIMARGYYWAEKPEDPLTFAEPDVAIFYTAAHKAAWVLSRRHHIVKRYLDDLVQNAVLRMLELYRREGGEGQLVNFAKFSMLEQLRIQYKINSVEILESDLEYENGYGTA